MSIEWITLIMFSSLIVFLALGLPIGFVTGGLAIIFTLLFLNPAALYNVFGRVYSIMTDYVMVAVPMFIFLAYILERSGITDDLFHAVRVWVGFLRGEFAIAVILAGTIMGAMVGIVGATVVSMTVIALPGMIKRNYDKSIALGSICAGGALGLLIPPSILFVFYGTVASESVGKLFMGGVGPGLVLSALYILYIGIRAYLQPDLCPAAPKEERSISFRQKVTSLRGVILPAVLILAILGSVYSGIAAVTEAAGIGALGAIVCAAIHRRLTWQNLKEASFKTISSTAMCMWILFGASAFVSVYHAVGGAEFVKQVMVGLPLGRWGILILMQIFLIIMGCFVDPFGILLLTIPIFVPVIVDLGFDKLWFAILFNVNMQIAVLSPPFGATLFFLKGAAPEIPMGDIYRSVLPFIVCQIIGLALCMAFPQIALWLPNTMIK